MLHAFVDDSGDKENGRLYLAAYVQTADNWDKFVLDWEDALAASPAIEFFHMAEAASPAAADHSDQFCKFTDQQRERKVLTMAKVIRRHTPWGFHAVVNADKWRKDVAPHVPYFAKDPYFVVTFGIMVGLAQFHEQIGIDEPCKFVIDKRDGLPEKVGPCFNAMLDVGDHPWHKLVTGQPQFDDDKVFKALQAADILAWHVRRIDGGNYPPEFKFLRDLLIIDKCHYARVIDDDFMDNLVSRCRSIRSPLDTKAGWREFLVTLAAEA